MKENNSLKANRLNHPSRQSQFKNKKPSIKVDYKVVHSSRSNSQIIQKKQGKKRIIPMSHQIQDNKRASSHVKSAENTIRQYQSGKFIQSQYCPTQKSRLIQNIQFFHKAKVADAVQRYQHSKSVERMIKGQYIKKIVPSSFISESRQTKLKSEPDQKNENKKEIDSSKYDSINYNSRISQRSRLPSYLNEGIKDIIQYQHAGKYKQQKVTVKCTLINQQKVKDKFRAFNQIHDFDFRKRINTLSNQIRLIKGLR